MYCAADIMSVEPITLRPTDSLKTAKEVMHAKRIRHLPVISAMGILVGLLSQRNLLQATVSFFADIPESERDQIETAICVSEIMSTNVLSVPPDMPLEKAGAMLLERKFGCLPVLENGKLLGILTESDFVKLSLTLLAQPLDKDKQGVTP